MTTTTPPPRKKLIEVSLPLDAINRESAREKSIRHGHPSTLHLWWARRPLAACRAVLFSSLVDDPSSDPHIGAGLSDEDREHAVGERREHLHALIRELVKWENSNNETIINAARAEIARSVASRLLELGQINKDLKLPGGDTVWDLIVRGKHDSSAKAIGLMRPPSPESVNAFLAEHAPPVLDPFCGGGSIPLEAQRLGLRAYASDLNPVPVLITKALIEIPPKFANMPPVHPDALAAGPQGAGKGKGKGSKGQAAMGTGSWKGARGLAADVRVYGKWMRDEAEKRIGHLYPKIKVTEAMARDRKDLRDYVGQELTAIAWLWTRTIKCPNPACGARAPMVRSFWLARKMGKAAFVDPVIDTLQGSVRFAVRRAGQPPKHTSDRTGGRCLFCDRFIKKPELRHLATENGVEALPFAVVCEGQNERVYLSPDGAFAPLAPTVAPEFLAQPMTNDKRWFSPPLYGMPNFADLFTPRQRVTLTTFSDLVMEARDRVLTDACRAGSVHDHHVGLGAFGDTCSSRTDAEGAEAENAYADAIATYLAEAVSKLTTAHNTLAYWRAKENKSSSGMGRQAIPMSWDYTEINPFAGAGADFEEIACQSAPKVLSSLPAAAPAIVLHRDVCVQEPMFDNTVVSTDPPYYDNIGYADLSDYFYIWLRRSLGRVYPELFRTVLTPKADELIVSVHRHGGDSDRASAFFESGMQRAFSRLQATANNEMPVTVFYAFKQAEDGESPDEESASSSRASTGWETMLEGMLGAGFAITGTWPMRTELTNALKGDVNALASSIVIVCHPRGVDAAMASRREFVAALKRELPDALRDLQSGSIAPVDLAQAAIGPGMAVFSRYAKVLEPSGDRMGVRAALGLINQVLDEVLAEQEGEYDADTRWAVKWFEQHAFDEGAFGDAETLAKATAVGVNGLVEAGILFAKGGKVRLLRREELMGGKPETWDPVADARLCHWEATQHLIHRLETGGEQAAADLLRVLGAGIGEVARDLAYRLYTTCERKKWAQEAISYNALVVSWPEIQKLAARAPAEAEGTLYS